MFLMFVAGQSLAVVDPSLPAAETQTVVVTASRTPEKADQAIASVTLIDGDRIERLGAPLILDSLRLAPSVSVSTSGPAGSLTDVRIRGAEANHTLLFIDGIRANDPAAGNAPRFELVNADLASRVEVVRGPQSALWGSEAIGGVVAVDGPRIGGGSQAMVEYGSFNTRRIAGRTAIGTADRGLALGLAGQCSAGIDSFSGHGERDGYCNRSARINASYRFSPMLDVGGSGFAIKASSEFDGLDPFTFARADTLDRTRNRLDAGRLYATVGDRQALHATASASFLSSTNRNLLGDDPINQTHATRRVVALEGGTTVGRHSFVAAVDGERETFRARDTIYGGYTDQDRSRRHQSLTAEWNWSGARLATDVALRHDRFSAFKDATTVRAGARALLGGGVTIAATYGQGIAQPSFFDLYGFFPGSFVGNPALKPEASRGGELALRFARGPFRAGITAYRQRLRNEIVDVFDTATFLSTTANASRTSRRRGIELEADYGVSRALRLSATYALLDASEPRGPAGTQIKEQRRPRHSGSIALDGASGRFTYGTAIAYTGARIDTDFDLYPAPRVRLSPYWLASGQVAYRLVGPLVATLRVANAFDSAYQDVVGYRTEGRSIHGGFRFAFGG